MTRDLPLRPAGAAALAVLVVACGPDPVVDGVTLDGTKWKALAVAGLRPVADREPTLAFEGEAISGWSGCNDLSWTYTSLLGGAISVRGLSVSDRECEGGNQVLDAVEERYFAALRAAQRIDIVEGRLVMSTGRGTLLFEPLVEGDGPVR